MHLTRLTFLELIAIRTSNSDIYAQQYIIKQEYTKYNKMQQYT